MTFQYTLSDARRIARAALVAHKMTWTDAMSPARTLPYTRARADVYVALRKHGWSLKKIALFCGRDHTTIMNALQQKEKSK
jgi:chromosomal replication initiation ATPase DnaA